MPTGIGDGRGLPEGKDLIISGLRSRLIHMKRTNLVLDEDLLEEATRLSGQRTYSRTVEIALEDFVRRARAGKILALAGTGLWEGDLSQMRRDERGAGSRKRNRASR
jgi:Arc/MetJ family transcription regulator